VSPAKMAERIEMPFDVFDGVHILMQMGNFDGERGGPF